MASVSLDTEQGKFYTWRQEQYVSVTTAIGDGVPKPGLARWMAKQVAEVAARERKRLAQINTAPEVIEYLLGTLARTKNLSAANTGSRVHALAASISFGTDTTAISTDEDAPFIEQFNRFLGDWKPVYIEAEAPVYNRTYMYAGTLDAVVTIGGKRYILDIKTGKGVWPEAALQLAAYANAEFYGRSNGVEEPFTKHTRGLVLHLRPDNYELIPVVIDGNVFDTFISALDMHRWMRDYSKYVIGTPKELDEDSVRW